MITLKYYLKFHKLIFKPFVVYTMEILINHIYIQKNSDKGSDFLGWGRL